jgi:cellobiose-specific phosphotransferase system component IIA
MATSIEKEIWMGQAKDAARKAVEYLEMQATGAARAELLNAVAAIEKLHKLAA